MFNITESDIIKVKESLLISRDPLRIKVFPAKEKRKYILLCMICLLFEMDKEYTESEVNDILKQVYEDFVSVRRYLIEYKFLDRRINGSAYWVIADQTKLDNYK